MFKNQLSIIGWGLLLLWPALVGQAPEQPANPEDGLIVNRVEIEGNETYTDAYLLSLIRTAPGTPYSAEQVQEDVRRIQQTAKFLDVLATPRIENGQVIVVFAVTELPTIVSVSFQGNVKFDNDELLAESNIAPGDPLERFAIEQGRENILTLYRTKGYSEAQVTLDDEALRADRSVIYRIVEGPRVRIKKIRYEGNENFSSFLLNSKITTRRYMWIFSPGTYDPDQVTQDELSIQAFLRGEGYLDARVSHRLDSDVTREKLILTFLLDEGDRYSVRDITFEGNTIYDDDTLSSLIDLRPAMYLRAELLRRDIRTITELYNEHGYIYTRCSARWVFADDPGLIDLTFDLLEGDEFTVGRVVVRGNRQTKDKVARREIDILPGQIFNLNAARVSERRLRETRLFSSAQITPVGEEFGVRDALVEVAEHERTTQFLIGAGVTSNSGVAGNIMIENRNFDLFDWPRNFSEFFKGQSFRGAGQTMRIQLEPGTEFIRFRIDFLEPYLFDREITFGQSFYLFQRGRDAFDEERLGLNVSLGKRFKKGFLRGWSGEVALRVENVKIDDVNILDSHDVREVEGNNYLSTAKVTLVHDTTDSRFLPSRGHRFRASYEQAGALGGDFYYGKLNSSYRWYRTIREDEFDRKQILALGARLGNIFGNSPLFERFYAGGIGSVRGFEFRGITPRQGLRDDRIGGDFLFMVNAEYSFPLVGDNLRGVVFSDMGTVEEEFEFTTWRSTIGAGIRLTVDFFGPIPMEFDFAIPLSKNDDDDTQVFSFFIGTTF